MKCKYCDGTGTSNWCVNGCFKPCDYCDGTGEVENQKQTNFQRITKSPEALAEFTERFANCSDDCPVSNKNICEYKCKKCKEALLAWLKQESD